MGPSTPRPLLRPCTFLPLGTHRSTHHGWRSGQERGSASSASAGVSTAFRSGIRPSRRPSGRAISVTPGPTLQADVGVRLGYRFVPFVFYERAILGVGSRFAGERGTSAYSELYGLGLRFVAGDVNTAAFLTEISVGERTVGVSANGQTFKMSGFEYFKLGLGAEIRLSTHLVLSPLASLSTGSMTSTSGSVTFSTAGSADGNTHPPFENGASITDQRGYVMLSLTLRRALRPSRKLSRRSRPAVARRARWPLRAAR